MAADRHPTCASADLPLGPHRPSPGERTVPFFEERGAVRLAAATTAHAFTLCHELAHLALLLRKGRARFVLGSAT
jgi:hypothetical protein